MDLRQRLHEIIEKKPDWTYQQYADCLGITIDTTRWMIKAEGLTRKKRGVKIKPPLPSKPAKIIKKKPGAVSDPRLVGSGKMGSTAGYTKLI
jgi:hypothetical protein